MILLSLLFIPIFGLLTVSVYDRIPGTHSSPNYTRQIKFIGLLTSILNLFISLIIFIKFDFSYNQFQFVQKYHNISYYDFYLGVDGLSIYFILLTCIIMPISLLSNWTSISKNVKSYVIILLLLEAFLLLVFLALDVLLYYIFFESILFPLFILIGLYGSSNKIRASFYLFLYTLVGSLFLLLSIISMYTITGVTDFDSLFKMNFDYYFQFFIFYGIFLSFAVKTPTIFLNNWLLKAHVESPLGGSLILASVVLKLSLYGIVRLILPILPKAYIDNSYIIYVIGVITIIYASIATLRTIDIKELIAYSSVSHAAVYFLGAFSNNIQGIEGAIIFGLAHGFVSSGLFICTGGILYDRSGNRLITIYRGLTKIMPIFSILFFILCLANAGAPLTFNFLGEFMCLYGAFEKLPLLGIFASTSVVFSAGYSMYMLNRIIFAGSISKLFMVNISDINKREFFMVVILVLFTIFLGIYPAVVTDGLNYYNTSLIYNYNNLTNSLLFFFLFTRNKHSMTRFIVVPALIATIFVFCIKYLYDMFPVFMFISICFLPVIEHILDSFIYNQYLYPLLSKLINSVFGNKLPINGNYNSNYITNGYKEKPFFSTVHFADSNDGPSKDDPWNKGPSNKGKGPSKDDIRMGILGSNDLGTGTKTALLNALENDSNSRSSTSEATRDAYLRTENHSHSKHILHGDPTLSKPEKSELLGWSSELFEERIKERRLAMRETGGLIRSESVYAGTSGNPQTNYEPKRGVNTCPNLVDSAAGEHVGDSDFTTPPRPPRINTLPTTPVTTTPVSPPIVSIPPTAPVSSAADNIPLDSNNQTPKRSRSKRIFDKIRRKKS